MDTRRLLAAAGDLVVGVRCAGCAAPGVSLCAGCRDRLHPRPRRCWPSPCPPELAPPRVTPRCAATYAGVVAHVVVAFKEHGRDGLAQPLTELLTAALLPAVACEHASMLVPMPSRWRTVQRRGYDPVLMLTKAAAHRLRRAGHDVIVTRALRYRRRVADQSGLSAQERFGNLEDAFESAAVDWSQRRVILVDDVLTTGATLAAAARAVRVSGADLRHAAVVAATTRG